MDRITRNSSPLQRSQMWTQKTSCWPSVVPLANRRLVILTLGNGVINPYIFFSFFYPFLGRGSHRIQEHTSHPSNMKIGPLIGLLPIHRDVPWIGWIHGFLKLLLVSNQLRIANSLLHVVWLWVLCWMNERYACMQESSSLPKHLRVLSNYKIWYNKYGSLYERD